MPTIATIGVYGFDRDSFLAALGGAGIDLLLDVRQRRGVRGSEYAWANARRLQDALAEAEIGYSHLKELAPTTAMRELQYREDDRRGEGKRSRKVRSTIIEPGAVDTELSDHIRDGIREKTRERFAEMKMLEGPDIADAIAYAVTRPWHVSLNEVLIRPTEQVG